LRLRHRRRRLGDDDLGPLRLAEHDVGAEAARHHHGSGRGDKGERSPHRAAGRFQFHEELLDRRGAVLALERQAAQYGRPLPTTEVRRPLRLQIVVACRQRRHAVERMPAGQQLVGDAGQRVNVVARVRIALLEHLRAGVGRGQRAQRAGVEQRLLGVGIIGPAGPGDAEIEHLRLAGLGHKHVARLEIAMDDLFLVRIGQRRADTVYDAQRLLERHAVEVGRAQDLVQRLPL
jgi:hypothetical protein